MGRDPTRDAVNEVFNWLEWAFTSRSAGDEQGFALLARPNRGSAGLTVVHSFYGPSEKLHRVPPGGSELEF